MGSRLEFCSVCSGIFKPIVMTRIFCRGRKQKRLGNTEAANKMNYAVTSYMCC